tara:strand:+ start:623 stop:805 length:183 start_codon:yes stop_codon:yes gene_type:complete
VAVVVITIMVVKEQVDLVVEVLHLKQVLGQQEALTLVVEAVELLIIHLLVMVVQVVQESL